MHEVDHLERFGLFVVLGGLALSLALFLTYILIPAERWLRVDEITVHDAREGDPIIMTVNREILRDFDGAWRAAVWRAERGGWVPICSTGWQEHNYRADARIPILPTLLWWTDDEDCTDLRPGLYRLDTEWRINVDSWWERDIRRPDVTFEILP